MQGLNAEMKKRIMEMMTEYERRILGRRNMMIRTNRKMEKNENWNDGDELGSIDIETD